MPDPASVGLTVVSVPLALKVLGPTADYIGAGLKEFTKRRVDNINAIFENAAAKLGARLDEPGQVPPKVLRTLVNDASYSEDTVSVEYFGGVLASARTPTGRDDRGARIARIVDGLSSYQIRTHYLIYSTLVELFREGENSFQNQEARGKMQIFVSFEGYLNAMQLTTEEYNPQLLGHIFHGLKNEGLIGSEWAYGPKNKLEENFGEKAHGDGIICGPSALGAEVFLWAFGHGDEPLNFLLTNGFSASIKGIPTLGSEATSTEV